MMHQIRVYFSGLTKSIIYLLILQTTLVRCQADAVTNQTSTPGSQSEPQCTPACGPGYKCSELAWCVRVQCDMLFNCSGVEETVLCGNNGVTYYSMCELKKDECKNAQVIGVAYEGLCITPIPPPAQICREHQQDFDSNRAEFMENCNTEGLFNGTLNKEELYHCYKPQCNLHTDSYLIKQCRLPENWCWCSRLDGHPIPGTFQSNMPPNYCLNRQECEVDGEMYKDGDIFTPNSVCGLCECLNGTHTCFVNITVESDGKLPNEQLLTLKKELISAFDYQYNHNSHAAFDIRQIYRFPVKVTDLQKEKVLQWKFIHYDRDENNELSRVEEFLFHREIFELFGCSKFYDHLRELSDTNGDNVITEEEWNDFFELFPEVETSGSPDTTETEPPQVDTVAKREASLTPTNLKPRPIHRRKKFHYVLV